MPHAAESASILVPAARSTTTCVKTPLSWGAEIAVARELGVPELRFFSPIGYGGGAACATVYHAAMAVVTGAADVVVCYRALNERSGRFGRVATADGAIELGGRLPINPHGGQLGEAYIHGMNGITEAVRRIRGTSVNQIPGVAPVLVTAGTGVPTSALILGFAG